MEIEMGTEITMDSIEEVVRASIKKRKMLGIAKGKETTGYEPLNAGGLP